jgi:glyoxylase-like metal-dependent hydrolase (beta-lactamase superfamily II)
MIIQGSSVMIPARRGGHLRSYLASLERLGALDPARAYPGHGSVIEQPRALIDEYLSHRRMREEQVIACLRAGVSAVDDIVARIYPDLPGGLKEPATQTIEAHLEKLREEGRVSARPRID